VSGTAGTVPEVGPGAMPDLASPDAYGAGVPHAALAWLRANDPVSWHDDPAGRRGFWLLARYDDVVAASRDTARFSSRGGVTNLEDLDEEQLDARRTMIEEDPPRHGALRSLVKDLVTPRAVRAYESFVSALARARVKDAVERSADGGWVDAVDAIAEPVPIRVLARLMGVPGERTEDLVDWGERLLGAGEAGTGAAAPGDDADAYRLVPFGSPVALEAFALADELAHARRGGEPDDLTARLAYGLVDGSRLSAREYHATWLLLVLAGNETTRHAISLGLDALAQYPEQFFRLRNDEQLLDRATDEVLRWSTPINWHRRTVLHDVDLAGKSLRSGDKVLLFFASANRDEAHFERPFDFDLGRHPNDHVTFGRGGPHFCLGAHLARLEIRAVLREVADQASGIERAGAATRLRSSHFNGLAHLPLTFTPAPGPGGGRDAP
jgi:cytochrome P450